MSDESDRPPGDGGGGGAGGRKPFKPIHAHDEFELDIDVETDMTQVASQRPGAQSLFDDDEDEPTQELSQAVLEEVLGPGQEEFDPGLPAASDEEVLPVFMPPRPRAPKPAAAQPAAPRPAQPAAQAPAPAPAAVPDLSAGDEEFLAPAPPGPRTAPDADDLFSDVSDINDLPPIHELSMPPAAVPESADPSPSQVPGLDLPPSSTSGGGQRKPRFGSGLTGGMQPLDVAQFQGEEPRPDQKKKRNRRTPISKGKAVPMAGSRRVVRRAFQFGVKEFLLLLLVILIGVGIWVGWSIYQDYRKRADWERFDQGRSQLEQTRSSQIEATQPKKERDDP